MERDGRKIWRLFAEHWHLFRGTPTQLWFTHELHEVFGVRERLAPETADRIYDRIADCLSREEFRPRALFERFHIEVLATTESPLDPLSHHGKLRASGWKGRVITTFRPDPVVDPDFEGFAAATCERLGATRRRGHGHAGRATCGARRAGGHTSRRTAPPPPTTATPRPPPPTSRPPAASGCSRLVRSGKATPAERELFRGQMLTEMARMSIEDGLVMQIHPGACRNHDPRVMAGFGRDKGADIPTPHRLRAGAPPAPGPLRQ